MLRRALSAFSAIKRSGKKLDTMVISVMQDKSGSLLTVLSKIKLKLRMLNFFKAVGFSSITLSSMSEYSEEEMEMFCLSFVSYDSRQQLYFDRICIRIRTIHLIKLLIIFVPNIIHTLRVD